MIVSSSSEVESFLGGFCVLQPVYLNNNVSAFENKTITFDSFSQGCREQLLAYFGGLHCSPNWGNYKTFPTPVDLLTEQEIPSLSVCKAFANTVFVACSKEIVPSGVINSNTGTEPCANLTEIYKDARSFLEALNTISGMPLPLYYDEQSSLTCFNAGSLISAPFALVAALVALLLAIVA
jgi:hypothetical protein